MGIRRELYIAQGGMDEAAPQEIDLLGYLRVIYRFRLVIILLASAAGLFSGAYSLFLTDVYRARVVISPIDREGAPGMALPGLLQGFGALSLAGRPGSTAEAEILSLLKSNILRKKLIEGDSLLPVVLYDRWDGSSWRGGRAPGIWDGIRALDRMTGIRSSSTEKTITISFEHPDPKAAAGVLERLLTVLNDHMSEEARNMADSNREFLETRLGSARDPLIRQKIYNLIAQQIESSMMAGAKENFAFKVIDPPMVPDMKAGPNRAKIVAASVMAAVFAGVVLALVLEYFRKAKELEGVDDRA